MIRSAYERATLIDSSAVIALHDPVEQYHSDAIGFYSRSDLEWCTLDVTAHEVFTRVRYRASVARAWEHFDFLRSTGGFRLYRFDPDDEVEAREILTRYDEHTISYHDALCAAAMKRLGILRIFSFDRDFAVMGLEMGFEVRPSRFV